jgi:hypothetical protein
MGAQHDRGAARLLPPLVKTVDGLVGHTPRVSRRFAAAAEPEDVMISETKIQSLIVTLKSLMLLN